MKFRAECPQCRTRYLLPAESFPENGGKVACRKCGTRWIVHPPSAAETVALPAPGSTPANVPGPGGAAPPGAMTASAASAIAVCPHCDFYFLKAAAVPLGPSETRPKVLLVEDQDFFRNLIREAVGDRYVYLVAPTPEQALRILAVQPVDLVILDMNLAGIDDGLDVLRGWRSNGVPVLILTGNEEPDLYGDKWEELRRLGATDLLIKGLNIREHLAMKITSLLNREERVFFQPSL